MRQRANMSKVLMIAIVLLGMSISAVHAQTEGSVGINTSEPQATLDVTGFPSNTSRMDGVIAPRITGVQLRAKTYGAAQDGAIVYVTLADPNPAGQTIEVQEKGYYYFDSTAGEWVRLACCTDSGASGTIASIDCAGATQMGNLVEGNAVTESSPVISLINYTGGNGLGHFGQTVASTGVTGLTATLLGGSFANGAGSLTYRITGTPATDGTANFAINIGGQTCTLSRTVAPQR